MVLPCRRNLRYFIAPVELEADLVLRPGEVHASELTTELVVAPTTAARVRGVRCRQNTKNVRVSPDSLDPCGPARRSTRSVLRVKGSVLHRGVPVLATSIERRAALDGAGCWRRRAKTPDCAHVVTSIERPRRGCHRDAVARDHVVQRLEQPLVLSHAGLAAARAAVEPGHVNDVGRSTSHTRSAVLRNRREMTEDDVRLGTVARTARARSACCSSAIELAHRCRQRRRRRAGAACHVAVANGPAIVVVRDAHRRAASRRRKHDLVDAARAARSVMRRKGCPTRATWP